MIMKKLSEMKIAKSAILSDFETATMGGMQVGSGTNYTGPDNPSTIETYVDGMPVGQDSGTGNLAGDSWNITLESSGGNTRVGTGQLVVQQFLMFYLIMNLRKYGI